MRDRYPNPEDTREKGAILLLVLVITTTTAWVMASAVSITLQRLRDGRYGLDYTAALALSEAVVEVAQKTVARELASFRTEPSPVVVVLDGEAYTCSVEALGPAVPRVSPDGITVFAQPYRFRATTTVNEVTARVDRIFRLSRTPLFQYSVFYTGDLEILPGPPMTLKGRIHSNGDLYIGSGHSLTVDTDYLRGTGRIQRLRKDDGSVPSGSVDIKVFEQTGFE